ncbi:MAG: hypothetical protein KF688_12475 [Pirellulales bacterium]|nr:hypothetical protein [Pirellulales bacterium]
MSEQTVSDKVAAWFDGDISLFDTCTEEPGVAWQAILEILRHDLTAEQTADLAAGPLESLLAWQGAVFIDRVEEEARRNPKFNHLGREKGTGPD